MSVKTITITKDAYTRLATLKEQSESFSDVICRVTAKNSLLELAGILSKKEAAELERAVHDLRRDMRKRLERITKEFA